MVFTDDTIQSSAMITSTSDTNEEVLAAELIRINEATSNAAELHLLQVEHAKLLLLQVKESVVHARKKHSLEMEQMKELHQLKVKKLEVEIIRTDSKDAI